MKKQVPVSSSSNLPAPNEGIVATISEKISVSPKTEAEDLAQIPETARQQLEQGMTQVYLSKLNQYALENGLISPDIYRKMEIGFRAYGKQKFSPFE